MQITNMKLSDIRPYDKNPRLNDNAVEAVANSIKEFGWRAPIVVDKEHVIICGHTRYKAAQRLGLAEVPVHVAENLTPEQVQAYRIADNKTAEIAEWNYVEVTTSSDDCHIFYCSDTLLLYCNIFPFASCNESWNVCMGVFP